MKLALVGAGGQIAQRIAREALSRGHEIVGVARSAASVRSDNERLQIVEGDATDAASVAKISKGADVIGVPRRITRRHWSTRSSAPLTRVRE